MKFHYSLKNSLTILVLFVFSNVQFSNAQTTQLIAPNNSFITIKGINHVNFNTTGDTAYLNRFSAAFYGITGTPDKAKSQSGGIIRFKTNSPNVSVNFVNSVNGMYSSRVFKLFKDDNSSVFETFTLSTMPGIASVKLTAGAGGYTTWNVVLPSLWGFDFTGITIDSGTSLIATTEPSSALKKYIAIGDSITHGVGQTDATQTYPYILAQSMGWELYNLGIAGSKITATMGNESIIEQADVVTVLWGFNNWNGSDTMANVELNYKTLITNLRTKNPTAEIYCIMPTYTTKTNTPDYPATNPRIQPFDDLRTAERKAVNDLKGSSSTLLNKNKIYIIEGGDITTAADLNDVVHLNVAGAARFGANLKTEMVLLNPSLSTAYFNGTNSKSVMLYPNPVSNNTLTIYALDAQDLVNIQLFDLSGKLVFTNKLFQLENQTVDLYGIQKGTYLTKILGQKSNFSQIVQIN
jgi:lysophospholipase L1-like esterase